MWYRRLKLYHWMGVGLAAGLLVGVSQTISVEEPVLGGPGFIGQGMFIRAVETPPIRGKSYVRNLAVRPSKVADGVDLVSFEALDTETDSYRPFFFAAPRPFAVGRAAANEYDSVWDYLQQVAVSNPAAAPQAAWWEWTSATLGFYALMGVLIIGGAWPALLRVTAGPETPEEEYDLDRFSHDEPDSKATANLTDQKAHLHELEEELEQTIGVPVPERSSQMDAAPVRRLQNGPYVPAAEVHVDEQKDYAGQYYPVEKHAPHGFSLVELVVVIGIVGLLFSFLMPSLRHARHAAEQVKCAYNLGQIARGLREYANANNDWMPAWSNWHTWPAGGRSDDYGPAWTVEMIPYLGNPDSPVYNCPSFPRIERYRNYFLESQWAGVSGRNAMRFSDIKLSGMFVLSGDKTNWQLYPSVEMDDTDPDDFGGGGALLWPWNGGFYMHRAGNNVLFDDGHVELCAKFDASRMTFNPHRVEDHDQVTPD